MLRADLSRTWTHNTTTPSTCNSRGNYSASKPYRGRVTPRRRNLTARFRIDSVWLATRLTAQSCVPARILFSLLQRPEVHSRQRSTQQEKTFPTRARLLHSTLQCNCRFRTWAQHLTYAWQEHKHPTLPRQSDSALVVPYNGTIFETSEDATIRVGSPFAIHSPPHFFEGRKLRDIRIRRSEHTTRTKWLAAEPEPCTSPSKLSTFSSGRNIQARVTSGYATYPRSIQLNRKCADCASRPVNERRLQPRFQSSGPRRGTCHEPLVRSMEEAVFVCKARIQENRSNCQRTAKFRGKLTPLGA